MVNELVRPASVIISHPNEAASVGGKPRPGSRTAELVGMLRSSVVLALSERTMDGARRPGQVRGRLRLTHSLTQRAPANVTRALVARIFTAGRARR
jgi:hypothetical protein